MNTRPMRDEDIPKIRTIYERSGINYELPNLLGADIADVTVVVDEDDQPVAAGIARQRLELVLVLDQSAHPLLKMQRVGLLHNAMQKSLRVKGHKEGFAFIPLAGWRRHLARWFGWQEEYPAMRIRG